MELVQKSFPVIQQHEILEQVVNARELHGFLGSKRQFANWIKSRIDKYDFIENVDYLVNKIVIQVPHQGGTRESVKIEYLITVTMAKELAMVENNAKGKEVRKYFIECERQAKQANTTPQITSIEDLLNASIEQGKTATEICNKVTKAESISFGMGSLHGKGLNKRKKEKKILKELQAITLKWMQFKLPFIEKKAVWYGLLQKPKIYGF